WFARDEPRGGCAGRAPARPTGRARSAHRIRAPFARRAPALRRESRRLTLLQSLDLRLEFDHSLFAVDERHIDAFELVDLLCELFVCQPDLLFGPATRALFLVMAKTRVEHRGHEVANLFQERHVL